MDAIFALTAGARARVLERAAPRIPGCLYVCLWTPVIAGQLPSSHLFCLDAWISNGGGGDRARAVFEAYRGALCAVVSGCVPGWAYKDGRAYMELPEPDLTASASLQVQQQFYHMAVFMGCDNGEIEIGLSTTSAPAVADHVQQSLLEELMQLTPTRPSSSSSSLPSLSIGSPEYSSLIRSMAMTVAAATEPSSQERQQLPLQPAVQLHGLLAPVYVPHGHAPFPSAEADDAAMAQAILAVISSSAPPAPITSVPLPSSPPWLARHHEQRSSPRRRVGAFKAYNAALSPRARPRPGAPGQRMIKTAIALMVSVHMAMRDRELAAARQQEDIAAAQPPEPPPLAAQPTSSQLHHMISERRRRERLNESFQTLKALLPPGSKKDKATVLANTTEYMNKLIAEVCDLEEKNRQLEARLGPPGETQQTASDDSPVKVQVDVTTGASISTSTSGQPQEVTIRVTVRAECDLSELVIAMLARIKEMGRFAVVTVDARQRSSTHAQVGITLRVAAGDDELDEASLKEAVAKVVQDAVTRPPSPPPGSP
ncbi:putative transcription factor bHLH041 isoform X2 [Phragmites australis]|uniref:putative transcription factor bHLH041 isoform X2 n=1 Tax=Phragmites australis TaxID=29695 RepID=UPI002D78F749|nr:putative transcription factor bHLH041 isoform X2 [Phragmites australis]